MQVGSGTGFVVAREHVLTNRHVATLENRTPAVLRVIDPATGLPRDAEVIALAGDRDLALLRVPGLNAPPVPLETRPPRRGEDVMILGYPESGVLGTGLKATRGIITALPDAAVSGMLLFDAVANPGNSGGPVCTERGTVCGVLTIGAEDFAGALRRRAGRGRPPVPHDLRAGADVAFARRPADPRLAHGGRANGPVDGADTGAPAGGAIPDHRGRDGRDRPLVGGPFLPGMQRGRAGRLPRGGAVPAGPSACRSGTSPPGSRTAARSTPPAPSPRRCPTCEGNDAVRCPHCGGRAVDPGL